MKYVKMLGLAAVAAAALMAFVGAGTASAGGVLCSTTANPCPAAQRWAPQAIHFTSEESVKLTTTGGFITAVTCSTATVKGTLETNPGGATLATGKNEIISWGTEATPCTKKSTTLVPGKLKIEQLAGTSNGTVIADAEIKVTVQGLFSGENCIYGVAEGTSIGTLTEGNPATFDAKAVATKFTDPEGKDNCPSGPATTEWSGKYQITEPSGTTGSVSSS